MIRYTLGTISYPLEAVLDVRERKRGKWVSKSGVGADRKKDVKIAKNGGGGIQIISTQ